MAHSVEGRVPFLDHHVVDERFGLGSKAADSAAFEKKGSYS
jgi:hypothetical protein